MHANKVVLSPSTGAAISLTLHVSGKPRRLSKESMKYLPTAFAQLQFAWKLYNYALDGNINLDALDVPITFQGNG